MGKKPDEKEDQEEEAYHFSEDFSEDEENVHDDISVSKKNRNQEVSQIKSKPWISLSRILFIGFILFLIVAGLRYLFFKSLMMPSIEGVNSTTVSKSNASSIGRNSLPLTHPHPEIIEGLNTVQKRVSTTPVNFSNETPHREAPVTMDHPLMPSKNVSVATDENLNHAKSDMGLPTNSHSFVAEEVSAANGPPVEATDGITAVLNNEMQAKMQALSAENEKLINHLKMEYTQKIGHFSAENKFLQEEMHRLNERIATMEAELHQLMRSMLRPKATRSAPLPSSKQSHHIVAPGQYHAANIKIPYNIQAIIPGRAWLLADNGETVTVTEGDRLQGFGQVTRIDPYDGVVDINMGHKIISLSYNNN